MDEINAYRSRQVKEEKTNLTKFLEFLGNASGRQELPTHCQDAQHFWSMFLHFC